MPSNSLTGQYKLRVEGKSGDAGNVFFNETDIMFTPKQASCFIQLSKPIYRQGQNVSFRVVPFKPNMMPKYGSMTIYVKDPTGFPVRRWLALQPNAGGDPRFDVNVTVRPYVMDNVNTIGGYINANMTTGKPIEGNATVVLTVKQPLPDNYDPNNPLFQNWFQYQKTIQLRKSYDYVNGPRSFEFNMQDIRNRIRSEINAAMTTLEGYEFQFNVSVYDWFFRMTREGYASTILVNSKSKLQWVGDHVRTFKPDSVFTVQVALINYDGTPVQTTNKIRLNVFYNYVSGGGGPSSQNLPVMYATPSGGIAEFQLGIDTQLQSLTLTAAYESDLTIQPIQMKAYRFYSPSNSYISLSTSTKNPKVNTYMIFHVKTSMYVPRIMYQVVGGGNIIVGEELEMVSRRKTFAIALSREMVPTAHIVVYYVSGQPEEIVVDSLTFFVDGTNLNKVSAVVNRGKDFTRDTIEIKAFADPGAYVAFSALPLDIYKRGLTDGLNEWMLIDELNSYDQPARGPWQHLWRLSETEFKYKFYTASGHGIDANSTFRDAGLLVLSDVTVNNVPMTDACRMDPDMRPCFDQQNCYHVNKTCDNIKDCPNDWADEQNCPIPDPRYDNSTQNMINRVSRVLRFYEDSGWAWHETFTKPDGEVDFRVKVPKYPLTWVIHGISVSRNIGLGIQPAPIIYDATRYMYIIVESPTHIIRGEQIGVRVTVFNYWYGGEYIEVLVTMKGSSGYRSVLVGKEGYVTAYNPVTHAGSHQTIVFLEPGQSKDIFMPLVPNMVIGNFTFTVTAWCFLERDEVSRTVYVASDGVENMYHTPYLVDMITYGSLKMPDLHVNVTDLFITPDQRYHKYIPGSPKARVTFFGDVVTPGFFVEYPTAEDIMYRPYGAGEMNMFNFAYNLITLLFKKANKQLSNAVTRRSLEYLNIALQRQFSYMNGDGSFRMFRDDPVPSMWLTAFVAKTLQGAKVGEWEKEFFVPVELLNKIVLWICDNQHNETGEFNEAPNSPVYDRNYDAQRCIETSKQRASEYLSRQVNEIERSGEIFHLAITAYALSLSQQRSITVFNKLWALRRTDFETYFADTAIRENPSDFESSVRYLLPRLPLVNDAYGVQSTAYALLAHINHHGSQMGARKLERDSMMRWLQSMRITSELLHLHR
ncbi:hypothetical protein FSP39_016806 [Pinctada imbricata]|uniref:Uncharacterized protein n=1 Tax=Pinctada imbricata TaxID=66713 RepID=A0AA88XJ47_PINIB|nr:hypothetical protein FSP39_016806 [Pinctada imbricata]